VRGECAALWYGSFAAHLREYGGRIAGMSTEADFLIARGCAREIGLLPLFEAAHDARGSHLVRHRLRFLRGAAPSLGPDADPASPTGLAALLMRIDGSGRGEATAADYVGPRSADHPGYLVSWLLAG
jgi:hypothetical protein